MLNVNRFLKSLIGKDVIVKLKVGVIKCRIKDVLSEGSLVVDDIKVINTNDNTLKLWEGKKNIVIRKDSVVGVFVE